VRQWGQRLIPIRFFRSNCQPFAAMWIRFSVFIAAVARAALHDFSKKPCTIFTVVDVCAIYCRHCFRKELVVDKDLKLDFDVDEGLKWIAGHPEIRDVLITGGDPLLLSDEKLAYLIAKLREMPHIEMIRIDSRLPIVLPQRVTDGLKNAIGGFHRIPVWINTQCNHPKKITPQTEKAGFDLMSCGVNVGNQAVLLKGINDDVETFKALHQKLLRTRIRPF
jgi:lysine 2,3-aminomutase